MHCLLSRVRSDIPRLSTYSNQSELLLDQSDQSESDMLFPHHHVRTHTSTHTHTHHTRSWVSNLRVSLKQYLDAMPVEAVIPRLYAMYEVFHSTTGQM